MPKEDDAKGGREVDVTVYYGAKDKTEGFRRNDTVDDVLEWAITAFEIDPSLASEFELARHGEQEELPGNTHIGPLTHGQKTLALDLVRGDIANGAAQ